MSFTTSIKKFIAKHTNFLLILLGVLIALALSSHVGYLREGLESIGEYEYLAPPPANNSFSDATWNAFVPVLNQVSNRNIASNDPQIRTSVARGLVESELKYFIVNKKFPIDPYVKKYIITNKDKIFIGAPNIDVLANDAANGVVNGNPASNRQLYKFLIEKFESRITPPPLSYQIYMGTVSPPSGSTSNKPLDANKRPKPITLR